MGVPCSCFFCVKNGIRNVLEMDTIRTMYKKHTFSERHEMKESRRRECWKTQYKGILNTVYRFTTLRKKENCFFIVFLAKNVSFLTKSPSAFVDGR